MTTEKTNYQGNSNAAKAEAKSDAVQAPVVAQKVVTGPVKIQKRGLGRKIKDLFAQADFKNTAIAFSTGVLIPAARDLAYDAGLTLLGRVTHGQDSRVDMRRGFFPGGGLTSRIAYQTPVARGIREVRAGVTGPIAPPPSLRPRGRHIYDEVILMSYAEAQTVLDMMNEIVDKYDVVTIANLNEMCGRATNPAEYSYGWMSLVGANIRQIPQGFLLELPIPEVITQ